jgi:hypothetical protein
MATQSEPNSEASAIDPGSLPTSMYSNPFTHTGIGLKGIQINLRRSHVATTSQTFYTIRPPKKKILQYRPNYDI